MFKFLKYTVLLVVLMLIVSSCSYKKSINSSYGDGKSYRFTVSQGDSVKKISTNLEESEIIESKKVFEKYVKKESLDSKIKAGNYELKDSMTIKEIVDVLVEGKIVRDEMTIKIIEGKTSSDIAKYLEEDGIAKESDFLDLVGRPMIQYNDDSEITPKDFSKEFSFLQDKPLSVGLEGYLFPDTYIIYKDADSEDIIRKMLVNFDNRLTPEMREEIEKQGKTIYEIVTLASVIQKEVRNEEDMKIVSGIFKNRMEIGQALQSCASLAYILGENKPTYTYEDTRIDSPYNTYINQGLPPGPISNPGIQAIEAAIYPTETDYYFFLSDIYSEDKKTIFSKTLQEHNINKQKYLK